MMRAIEIGRNAALSIDTADGEFANMALVCDGRTLALGEGFRVAEAGRWTWLDMPEREVVDTFGAFLSHAVESSDDEARKGWPVLTDEAADWADELALFGEDPYGTCDVCGEPADYCLGGHGDRIEVEQSARMVCVVDGLTFAWSGGAYIDVDAIDCIGVWDYATDKPTISRTLDAFEARCVEYAREALR